MARHRLPPPKMPSFSGYVKWQGFNLVEPLNVRSAHPSIVSNSSIN
jgi:hypothetical protein